MNVVKHSIRPAMVLDSGPGQAYLLRRGTQAVLIDTGIAGQGDAIAGALAGRRGRQRGLLADSARNWHTCAPTRPTAVRTAGTKIRQGDCG